MDAEKLISAVFVRTPLWDQKDKNHHNRFVLDKLWDEIGREFNTKRDVPRAKWKALRDKFRKVLAAQPVVHSGADGPELWEKHTWPLFQNLYFLKDQFTPRKSTGNFPLLPSDDDTENSNDQRTATPENSTTSYDLSDTEDEQDTVETSTLVETETSDMVPTQNVNNVTATVFKQPPARKRTKYNDSLGAAFLKIEEQKLQYLQGKKRKNNDDEENLCFLKSLIPKLTTLTPHNKLTFQIKVLELLQNLLANQVQVVYTEQNSVEDDD